MNIKIINPIEYPDWDNILLTHNDYSFFYSSSWTKVLCESYNYSPLYFTSISNGKLTALIPVIGINSIITGKRGVSLPFSDYCQPIVPDKIHFRKIFEKITKFGNKSGWKYIEYRGGDNYLDNNTHSLFFFNHNIDLGAGEKKIHSRFRSNTKRNIKKALKSGVEVNLHQSMESVKDFCHLNFMTRKKHGLPPQPSFFFKKIYEHIISKGLGFVVLATYKNKKIAGAIYFHIGEKAIYKFGAYDKNYQELRPNNLVMWHAIQWYSQNNYKSFDFGITGSQNEGLRHFKLGWGVDEKIISYYRYNLLTKKFIKDNFRAKESYSLFRKLPSPLLNLTGFFLYRHVG